MTLTTILALLLASFLIGFVRDQRLRVNLLLAASILAVFALQPVLPVRSLDFFLPMITIALTTFSWVLTTPRENRTWKNNWMGVVLPAGITLVLALTRYLGFSIPLTASPPPQILIVLVVLAIAAIPAILISGNPRSPRARLTAGFILILTIFIILKVPVITQQVSIFLRTLSGQALETASSFDIRWLGYSYIAFRILHTIRDRQTGRLIPVTLPEYIVFVLFFPTLSAGPIDRMERFSVDLRDPKDRTAQVWGRAGKRLVIGLFKKFVLADTLAIVALDAVNAQQVHSTGWAWVLIYAYAFQIYFDFSGYTDIAIGMGYLLGIQLPENFNRPYLKTNLTQFWNNWHMTLTQWFRAYFFNPVTRALRSGKRKLPISWIVFLTQVATMVLIGLWHGVSWNFILWGLWHGAGLFVHNRWSDWTKARFAVLTPFWQKTLNITGTLITFHYVTLGWVFFALPVPSISVHFFQVLLGYA